MVEAPGIDRLPGARGPYMAAEGGPCRPPGDRHRDHEATRRHTRVGLCRGRGQRDEHGRHPEGGARRADPGETHCVTPSTARATDNAFPAHLRYGQGARMPRACNAFATHGLPARRPVLALPRPGQPA